MKKIIVLLIGLVMMMTLFGCDKADEDKKDEPRMILGNGETVENTYDENDPETAATVNGLKLIVVGENEDQEDSFESDDYEDDSDDEYDVDDEGDEGDEAADGDESEDESEEAQEVVAEFTANPFGGFESGCDYVSVCRFDGGSTVQSIDLYNDEVAQSALDSISSMVSGVTASKGTMDDLKRWGTPAFDISFEKGDDFVSYSYYDGMLLDEDVVFILSKKLDIDTMWSKAGASMAAEDCEKDILNNTDILAKYNQAFYCPPSEDDYEDEEEYEEEYDEDYDDEEDYEEGDDEEWDDVEDYDEITEEDIEDWEDEEFTFDDAEDWEYDESEDYEDEGDEGE